MKILVVGATGMLAKPVITHLEKQGFSLRLFSRSSCESLAGSNSESFKGNVFVSTDLKKALTGCDAVHINLSKTDENCAVREIVKAARRIDCKLISYISGCTVCETNRWFPLIDSKYRAEQEIISSGIPYIIFRPTWFFESLNLMIRNNKPVMIGNQPNPYRWISADDYGRIVARAYNTPDAGNKIFYVYGKESYYMKDLLLKYGNYLNPDIKKVSILPVGFAKTIAFITGNKELKVAASMFSYFERVQEPKGVYTTDRLLGKPETGFSKWLEQKEGKHEG